MFTRRLLSMIVIGGILIDPSWASIAGPQALSPSAKVGATLVATQALAQPAWMARPLRLWRLAGTLRRQRNRGLLTSLRLLPQTDSSAELLHPSSLPLELLPIDPRRQLVERLLQKGVTIEGARFLSQKTLWSIVQEVESPKATGKTDGLRIRARLRYIPITLLTMIGGLYEPKEKTLQIPPFPSHTVVTWFFSHEFEHHLTLVAQVTEQGNKIPTATPEMRTFAEHSWIPVTDLTRAQRLVYLALWVVVFDAALHANYNALSIVIGPENPVALLIGIVVFTLAGVFFSFIGHGQVSTMLSFSKLFGNENPLPSYILDTRRPWNQHTLYGLFSPYEEIADLNALMRLFPTLVRHRMRHDDLFRNKILSVEAHPFTSGDARPFITPPVRRERWITAFLLGAGLLVALPSDIRWAIPMILMPVVKLLVGIWIFVLIPAVTLQIRLRRMTAHFPSLVRQGLRFFVSRLVGMQVEFQRLAIGAVLLGVLLGLTDTTRVLELFRPRPIPWQEMLGAARTRSFTSPTSTHPLSLTNSMRNAGQAIERLVRDISHAALPKNHLAPRYNVVHLYEPTPQERLIDPPANAGKTQFPPAQRFNYTLRPKDYSLRISAVFIKQTYDRPYLWKNGVFVTDWFKYGTSLKPKDSIAADASLEFEIPQEALHRIIESAEIDLGGGRFFEFANSGFPPFWRQSKTTVIAYVLGKTTPTLPDWVVALGPDSSHDIGLGGYKFETPMVRFDYTSDKSTNPETILIVDPQDVVLKLRLREDLPTPPRSYPKPRVVPIPRVVLRAA